MEHKNLCPFARLELRFAYATDFCTWDLFVIFLFPLQLRIVK